MGRKLKIEFVVIEKDTVIYCREKPYLSLICDTSAALHTCFFFPK